MISFTDAYDIVVKNARATGVEIIDMAGASGRILAEDVFSDTDMPPFNKSAMDGYACISGDVGCELAVIEEIPAGRLPLRKVCSGQCSKIMTGATLPEGADCVIIVEDTKQLSRNTIGFTGRKENYSSYLSNKKKSNVCLAGEDIKAGDLVLRKGTYIKPQHVAVLATVGHCQVKVACRPKVGIIATGTELVEPSERIYGSKIRNSNSSQLVAQAERTGADPVYYGIAEDSNESIMNVLALAQSECDVIVISGGVSMGDYDLVPECLKKIGVKILFDRVAVQPGKPTTFGVSEQTVCFGMPGNPVSTFIQFEFLVRPFLFRMMGCDYKPDTFMSLMGESFTRKKADRLAIIPVEIRNNEVYPIDYHGSAHINSMVLTDFVITIPSGVSLINKGEPVEVRKI